MIKVTLITILIYWILKTIARLQYKSLSEFGKARYSMRDYTTGETVLLLIVSAVRAISYIMAFATAFYMIFKYL